MVPHFIMLPGVAKSQGLHILSSDTCCQTVFQKTAPTNTDFQLSIHCVTGAVLYLIWFSIWLYKNGFLSSYMVQYCENRAPVCQITCWNYIGSRWWRRIWNRPEFKWTRCFPTAPQENITQERNEFELLKYTHKSVRFITKWHLIPAFVYMSIKLEGSTD